MSNCNTCGMPILPGGPPVCGDCRDMVKKLQKQASARVSAPQRVYVQQPVYYPVPYYQSPPQQYVPQYPAPQYYGYGYQQPAQQDLSYPSAMMNYGAPPAIGDIQDDRTWHPLYFFLCGLWILLAIGAFLPFLYLGLIWRPTRVLFGVVAGYW